MSLCKMVFYNSLEGDEASGGDTDATVAATLFSGDNDLINSRSGRKPNDSLVREIAAGSMNQRDKVSGAAGY